MRFSIIEREPEMLFDTVRNDLEKLVNGRCTNEYRPCCEIRENDKEYKINLMLPGMNKEDIDIELEDNVLTVKAEVKQHELSENEKILMSEFSYGEYSKSVRFEKEIDIENSRSEYNNGILTITLAKMQETEKNTIKKISIQ
jgi:HSP20 family protein